MRILDWRDFVASFVLEELPQLRQAAFIRRTIGKFEHQSIVGFIRLTLREKRKKDKHLFKLLLAHVCEA